MRTRWLLLLVAASTLPAQTPPSPHFVRASGEATVTAKPDRASLEIGVVTRAATAEAAARHNAQKSSELMQTVRQTLGSGGEVKTTNYSLTPQYEYPNNQPARLLGYDASNAVIITLDDLSLLGKIIDAASKNGANTIGTVSFSLKDDSALRVAALREATIRARANAEAIAGALHLQVVSVLQAEPASNMPVRPMMLSMRSTIASEKAVASTPIDSGTIEVSETVTVTLETR